MDRFVSIQQMRTQVEEIVSQSDDYIPEPDWSEFRSDVRNALLSRSVKREASKRWLAAIGWKPVMAFGIAVLLIIGIGITHTLWNPGTKPASPEIAQVAPVEDSTSDETQLQSLDAVARTDVFEDLLHLNSDEVASLQMILDDISPEGVSQQ
jgi:hypothetical protein